MFELYLAELRSPDLPISKGAQGITVRRLQEWLRLAGFKLTLDGDFGPATEGAVIAFQQYVPGSPRDGIVDKITWDSLIYPLSRATAIPSISDKLLGDTVLRIARQHLLQLPREVGGNNRGPWQRHYSRGREGQAWCLDFAFEMLLSACRIRQSGTPAPVAPVGYNYPSSWVPWAVGSFKDNGRLVSAEDHLTVAPGSLFFVRGLVDGEWSHVHTGIVVEDRGDHFSTIEGNTNISGSPDGDGVQQGFRARTSCDFGLVN